MEHRKFYTEMRISAHNLEIEKGRYLKIPREDRLCKFCINLGTSVIGDELHFLLQCPLYEDERVKFLRIVSLECPHFVQLPIFSQLMYLLTAEGKVCLAVSQFCSLRSK